MMLEGENVPSAVRFEFLTGRCSIRACLKRWPRPFFALDYFFSLAERYSTNVVGLGERGRDQNGRRKFLAILWDFLR
jgi:hypothetical protein